MSEELLQFHPFNSAVDAGFWYQLSKRKLEVFRLSEAPVEIYGFYSGAGSSQLPPLANIDYSAFDEEVQIPSSSFPLKGILINTNTLEEFKKIDKKRLLQSAGQKVWENITNGAALKNPLLLQNLLFLTFADLKKYVYYYWVAFPALNYPESTVLKDVTKFCDVFTPEQTSQFLESYELLSSCDKTVFLIQKDDTKCSAFRLDEYSSLKNQGKKILLGFSDPSKYDKFPGWPLRNALALVAYHWGEDQSDWNVVCFIDYIKGGERICDRSTVLSVHLKSSPVPESCPDVVGWERHNNKLAPRKVDMSASMDPPKLADAAVDLNLKLMRWRLAPDLQLEFIKSRKCLLFGAGTLGCNVARALLGWGIRKITFVDNSNVSYSNPVRQTLFTFEDCLQGGERKALAAASALKKIFPLVESEGHVLNIPMPGHAIPENTIEQVRKEVSQIEELVAAHDVIFLLTDSRESRWLPTLLGAANTKIVINAALGFDTFLIMRHGFKVGGSAAAAASGGDEIPRVIEGSDLGCYFCNDVTAPGNTMTDRTLDQQCTVTRPGTSYMAAGYAVELLVSVLQHPKKAEAPATILDHSEVTGVELSSDLGMVPHQIRGHLDRFQNTLMLSKAFNSCTACSTKVVDEYKKSGFEFLLKVFNDATYLEEITGLTELIKNINMADVYALSDDEDF